MQAHMLSRMETELRSEHEVFGVLENEAKMTYCKECGHKLGIRLLRTRH